MPEVVQLDDRKLYYPADGVDAFLKAIAMSLTRLTVGSCNCLTKTHEPEYHRENCHYRMISELRKAIHHRKIQL